MQMIGVRALVYIYIYIYVYFHQCFVLYSALSALWQSFCANRRNSRARASVHIILSRSLEKVIYLISAAGIRGTSICPYGRARSIYFLASSLFRLFLSNSRPAKHTAGFIYRKYFVENSYIRKERETDEEQDWVVAW